jgi:CO/xanthine dehydrogenase Mo-binding subunit
LLLAPRTSPSAFANIIEQTSQAQGETVMVRLDPGGTATVIPGSISHGQGHETMYKIHRPRGLA